MAPADKKVYLTIEDPAPADKICSSVNRHITTLTYKPYCMIRNKTGESWKTLRFSGWKQFRYRYALSTQGSLASFQKDIFTDGKILKGSVTTGYRTLNLHRRGEKGTLYLHRELARLFVRRPSARHQYVIHLNHNKLDNRIRNLAWVTAEEMIKHQQSSPARIAYKKLQAERPVGLKLTVSQVKKIREILNNPNRKLSIKQVAAKYMVSEMTIYRIKSGENWSSV